MAACSTGVAAPSCRLGRSFPLDSSKLSASSSARCAPLRCVPVSSCRLRSVSQPSITPKVFLGGYTRSKSRPPSGARCLLNILPLAAISLSHDLACVINSSRCIQPAAASLSESSVNATSKYLQGSLLILADLDPATAKLAIGITGPFLSAFGFLFVIRIVMSWYPKLPVGKFPYVLAYAPTEPFLRVTRKVIPPLGGVDVTPVVWFGLVSFLNEILVGPQGLLVLLSQQI